MNIRDLNDRSKLVYGTLNHSIDEIVLNTERPLAGFSQENNLRLNIYGVSKDGNLIILLDCLNFSKFSLYSSSGGFTQYELLKNGELIPISNSHDLSIGNINISSDEIGHNGEYTPEYVLISNKKVKHFDTDSEFVSKLLFHSVNFSFTNIDKFIDISPFNYTNDKDYFFTGLSFENEYYKNNIYKFTFKNQEITLKMESNILLPVEDSIKKDPISKRSVKLTAENPMPLNDWKDLLDSIFRLIILITDNSHSYTDIVYFYYDEKYKYDEDEIEYFKDNIKNIIKFKYLSNQLSVSEYKKDKYRIKLSDIKENLENILKKWIKFDEDYWYVTHTILSEKTIDNYYIEYQLINNTTMLEVYHRIKYKNEIIPDNSINNEEYIDIKGRILEFIGKIKTDNKIKKIFNNKIKHNSPTLRERLIYLFTNLDPSIKEYIFDENNKKKEIENICTRITQTRNFYTHGLSQNDQKKRFKDSNEMYIANEILKMVSLYYVYVEIGIEENMVIDYLKQYFKGKIDYDAIKSGE